MARAKPVTKKRACRMCGCTDDDCRQCIEKTGEPCRWVKMDLCSACVVDADESDEAIKLLRGAEELRKVSWIPAELILLLMDVPGGDPIWDYTVKGYILGLLAGDSTKIAYLKRLWVGWKKKNKGKATRVGRY